jgi:hypothetical protein
MNKKIQTIRELIKKPAPIHVKKGVYKRIGETDQYQHTTGVIIGYKDLMTAVVQHGELHSMGVYFEDKEFPLSIWIEKGGKGSKKLGRIDWDEKLTYENAQIIVNSKETAEAIDKLLES